MKVLVGAEVEKLRSRGRIGLCLKSSEYGVLAFSAVKKFPFHREYKGWREFLIGYRPKEFPETHSLSERDLHKISGRV